MALKFDKYQSDLEAKMEKIRERRRSTSEPQTELDLRILFSKLNVCNQPEDGPCRFHKTIDPEDKRCVLSRGANISCPYLGKVEPLKILSEKKEEQKRKAEMIVELPPKI